jgi:hypothetical protein
LSAWQVRRDFIGISSCRYLGFLERPDEVYSAIIEFLGKN